MKPRIENFSRLKAVLHIVNTATKFSAEAFLDVHRAAYNLPSDATRADLLQTCCKTRAWYPQWQHTSSRFLHSSKTWEQSKDLVGVDLHLAGVKAQNVLDIGKPIHYLLGRTYRKLRRDHKSLSPKLLPNVAVWAMNDSIGENRNAHYRPCFCDSFKISHHQYRKPTHKRKMDALALSQAELNPITSRRRCMTSLTQEGPPAAGWTFTIGLIVLIYSE